MAGTQRDYYEVLGVARDADSKAIKDASTYRHQGLIDMGRSPDRRLYLAMHSNIEYPGEEAVDCHNPGSLVNSQRRSGMAKEEKQEKKEGKQELQQARPARALNPFEEMERMFDNYFSRGWLSPLRREWPSWSELAAPFEGKMPRVDVVDRDDEVVVKAEVPGVDKKDLDITVTDNSVTIKGSTSHEEKEEKGDYYRCEMSRGSFSRMVALPADVDSAKAKSKFKDGVLELTLPKLKKTKRHSIKID
jgi:HSP20 family protein